MFSTGPLPLFSASGVPVELLWFIPWQLRHAAAATPRRELVLAMAEEGDGDIDALQTPAGRAMLTGCLVRVRNWAVTPIAAEPTEDQLNAMFEPWKPLGS